jgi:hypothetical protein
MKMARIFNDVDAAKKEIVELLKDGKKEEAIAIIKELQTLGESLLSDVNHSLAFIKVEDSQPQSPFLEELKKINPNFKPAPIEAGEAKENFFVKWARRKRGDR